MFLDKKLSVASDEMAIGSPSPPWPHPDRLQRKKALGAVVSRCTSEWAGLSSPGGAQVRYQAKHHLDLYTEANWMPRSSSSKILASSKAVQICLTSFIFHLKKKLDLLILLID